MPNDRAAVSTWELSSRTRGITSAAMVPTMAIVIRSSMSE
jgi:hypothetical protein